MAITEGEVGAGIGPVLTEVARGIGRHGIAPGPADKATGNLRISVQDGVRRTVQIYWTPFQVNIEGECVALYLEVPKPTMHWTEGYLTPDTQQVNWVLCFYERPDGDIQLAYYREYRSAAAAAKAFFDLSAWYTLTATDKTWADVAYEVAPDVDWKEEHEATAGASTSAAVQESIKKSTIMWLRWRYQGTELTMPVWYLLDNKTGLVYILSGERQQTLPGAAQIREAEVILRQKGKNIQVAEIPASVRVLQPGDEWNEVAEKIAEKRLNIPGLPEDTARRWRDECVILELRLKT